MSATDKISDHHMVKYRVGVSLAALVVAASQFSPAWAGNYTASNPTELANAITAANADTDGSSTITLSGNISGTTGALPAPTKPISIDTNGFTMSGFQVSTDQTITFSGTIVGDTAQRGFYFTITNVSSSLINNGSITGGADGTTITSAGINFSGPGTFVNNGTVIGGSNTGASSGGFGILANRPMDITNNGLIQGGGSAAGAGTEGLRLGGIAAATSGSLTNNGTIRGGSGATGSGAGVRLGLNSTLLTNNGLIEGGSNTRAITVATPGVLIVNSGTIQAGAGGADAIDMNAATDTVTLELRQGSTIIGNVVGNATLEDTLRLGGTGTDNFDVSTIGAAAQYQNFDTFEKTGTGTWLLTGIATATTDWTIYDGTLLIGDHTTSTSVIGDITNFGTLGGSGTITGDVSNSGTVAPGNSIGTLTVNGNYTGNGGTLALESVLAGDASSTDRLVVTGDTAGTTTVRVTNLGGTGAQTSEGIKIIDVGGTSAGSFSLDGDYVYNGDQAIVGGAYAYRLYQNGIATPADGDWYLRSDLVPGFFPAGPLYQAGVPIYEAYPQLLRTLNSLGTLQQRIGDRYWQTDADQVTGNAPDGVWLRTEGTHGGVDPKNSTAVSSYDYDLWRFEGGLDGALADNASGRLIGGVSLNMGTISADINSLYGNGTIDASGYGFGATLTWYGDDGLYLDAQGRLTWYNSDLKSDLAGDALVRANKGFGSAISLEAGRRFSAEDWTITPQAQIVYSATDFDDFNDRFGAPVSLVNGGESLNGRLGVAVDHDESWQKASGQTVHAKLYGAANLYYEFLGGSAVDVAGVRFSTENEKLAAGLTFGGSYSWNEDRTALYGEVTARSSLEDFADTYAIGGTAGIRVKW